MGRLFGTDGARGIANTEISCELAMKIGRATAMVLGENSTNQRLKVLIGTDTRKSADMLASAISAGFCSVGCDVLQLGVVPTPAVAFLVKEYSYDAGVMISASHNPCEYNGIKIFRSNGYKLPDEMEERIEAIILDEIVPPPLKVGGEVGEITSGRNAVKDYIRHIESTAIAHFYGMRIAIDCANGSASVTANELFRKLGAECTVINCRPDGVNINLNCGSTHIQGLCDYVRENKLDVGFAFDGDADRCLAVDEKGQEVNGDKIMYICAKYLKSKGQLPSNTVVTTIMSNFGLYKALDAAGINYEKTAVGDRYVYENMKAYSHLIGGEQSGHIIFRKHARTGDGLITAIMLMGVMIDTQLPLSVLAEGCRMYPQVLKNVVVDDKDATLAEQAVMDTVSACTDALGDSGRVLLRKSGTEPVLRVMAEAGSREECEKNVDAIIESMQKSGHLIEVKK